jgi:hypothetical protein
MPIGEPFPSKIHHSLGTLAHLGFSDFLSPFLAGTKPLSGFLLGKFYLPTDNNDVRSYMENLIQGER